MKQHSILLVDKEPKNLNILENNFAAANYQVDKATSDYEALKSLSSKHYDVILSEVSGPSLDGYHILEQLQRGSTTSDIPVVFLTQKSDIWNRVKSFKLGAKDYIVKPMHVKEIVGRINMLLNRLEKYRAVEVLAKKKFAGRIEDFSLADLIETFGTERKTGILGFVNKNGASGQVFFDNGRVVDAEMKGMTGEAAIFRMMVWNKGRFSMLFTTVENKDSIKISNLGLLLEGARRMEQRDELLKHIPSLEAVVVTTSNFRKILEQKALSQDLKEFLELFDGERTVSRIIDESPEDELTILSRIAKLSNLGFLHVLRDFTTSPERLDQEELEPVSSEQLSKETGSIFTDVGDTPDLSEDHLAETVEQQSDEPGEHSADTDEWHGSAQDRASLMAEEKSPIREEPFEATSDEDQAFGKTVHQAAEMQSFQKDEEELIPQAGQEEQQVKADLDPFRDETGLGQKAALLDEITESDAQGIEDKISADITDHEQASNEPELTFDAQSDPFAEFTTPEETVAEKDIASTPSTLSADSHPADKLLDLSQDEELFEPEPFQPRAAESTSSEIAEMAVAGSESAAEGPIDIEEIKRRYGLAKGNILVLGTDEVHRQTFIDSLAGPYTNTTETGLQNMSPVYYGTAEFKGNHYLNLISFSIKNEFTPLVEYFAPKSLAYILIIEEQQPDWPYLNYLMNVLRNKLHKPSKIIFTNKDITEESVRSKLNLKASEAVSYCDNFVERETKKIIFSLFVK